MAEKACEFEGCGRPAYAKVLCRTHYRQQRAGAELTPIREWRRHAVCGFAGCDRRHFTHGLCSGHYAQHYAGKGLTPLRERRSTLLRDADGRKRCRRCDEWGYEDAFSAVSKAADGLHGYCKQCVRTDYLERTYNITADIYDALLAAQGGVCAICKQPDPSGKALAVDHDHACCPDPAKSCGACVRGLSCWPCNTGLGHFRDNAQVLRAAADYLERAA